MKTVWGSGGIELSASHHGERAPGTHQIGGWVDPKLSMDAVAIQRNPFTVPARNRTPLFHAEV